MLQYLRVRANSWIHLVREEVRSSDWNFYGLVHLGALATVVSAGLVAMSFRPPEWESPHAAQIDSASRAHHRLHYTSPTLETNTGQTLKQEPGT